MTNNGKIINIICLILISIKVSFGQPASINVIGEDRFYFTVNDTINYLNIPIRKCYQWIRICQSS